MNPSKILAFLNQQSRTQEELIEHFDSSCIPILNILLKEESLCLKNNVYNVNNENFTSSILSWQCGEQVEYLPQCKSTNDEAEWRAREGWTGVVTTDFQEKGRGRIGRVWQSCVGENLLFSMVVRPKVDITQASRCTLVWAAEIAEELGLHVKWPNDIVDEKDQKIGGLLSSMHLKNTTVDYIIFGVGLNVNQRSFVDLPQATSLSLRWNQKVDRVAILKRIVDRIRCTRPTKDFTLWKKHSRTLGRKVRIGNIEGIASTIREDGALIVGGTPVLTGDVHLMEGE
jgi:BirA family transcriptional regulator, biotin operon repressor / biotin---[acetyl-CoA-carboxylase] ligase